MFHQFKIGLVYKITVFPFLIFLFSMIYIRNQIHSVYENATLEGVQERLLGIARTAASWVSGDDHDVIFEPLDFDLPEFTNNVEKLREIKKVNYLHTDLWTLRCEDLEQATATFILMTNPKPYIGNLYPCTPTQISVFKTGLATWTSIYSSSGKKYISAFAPIYNSKKQISGIVGVDEPQVKFQERVEVLTRFTRNILLITFAIASLLSFLWGYMITRPVKEIVQGLAKLEEGDTSHQIQVQTLDEFGDISKAFNKMVFSLKERDLIKQSFGQYVSSSLVEKILKDPDSLKIGGQEKEVTIFFSDIAGFTKISENIPAELLVERINNYFQAICDPILKNGGHIDKFLGDAVMAYWNAPLDDPDHINNAVQAALEITQVLRDLEKTWLKENIPPFKTRIGLHSGSVIAGNMGFTGKLNYTIMGDEVNFCSRLEGANKIYGTEMLIGEETALRQTKTHLRFIDEVVVKGKAQSKKIFEILGKNWNPKMTKTWELAHLTYKNGDFASAEKLFGIILETLPDDPPAQKFLERCRLFQKNPPKNWNGTFFLDEK